MNAPNVNTAGRSEYLVSLDDAWTAHKARRKKDAPSVMSLFAGAGGSSLGYSMAGFRELLAAEWDADAVATFKANFSHVPMWDKDVSDLTVEHIQDVTGLVPGQLDVLDGSPPCQGFSTAGNRILDDPRNSLFREFVRILDGLKPKTFIMENVGGMVKGRMKLVFAEILRMLKGCKYEVSARLMDTAYFGVPQHRRRLLFVGVRNDMGCESSHPKGSARLISIAQAIGDLPKGMDESRGHMWIDESPQGRNTKTWSIAHRTKQGREYAVQHKRDSWHKPAATLITSGLVVKPYIRALNCHPIYTRTYSAFEYRRLGAFPDAFVVVGDWWNAYKQIGNSVPPLFMRAIAEHIHNNILKQPRA